MTKLFLLSAIVLSVFTSAQESFSDSPLLAYASSEDMIVTNKSSNYTYIQLENIYFSSGEDDIQSNSLNTLDILVGLLYKYPSMNIELRAHTDTRGQDDYNFELSQQRAEAARAYLIDQGIKASRLVAKGFGKSDPLVPCGENCTDDQNTINRRCEIIIVK